MRQLRTRSEFHVSQRGVKGTQQTVRSMAVIFGTFIASSET
jgi:hypothetical protein